MLDVMIRIYHRAANDSDLKAMRKFRGSLWSNLLLVTLPAAAALFVIAWLLSRSLPISGVVAGGFFLASLISNARFFREVNQREQLKSDAHAVEVTEVEASHVLDIEHLGSYGPAYCFFVGEGKALLLVGQWLLDCRSFPSSSFRLHRWSDTGKPIRIEPTGKRIKPQESTARLRAGYKAGDVEIFDAAPETVQVDMDRAFSANAQTRDDRN
jgi:hypothetical protein